jgi:hypothetical protein
MAYYDWSPVVLALRAQPGLGGQETGKHFRPGRAPVDPPPGGSDSYMPRPHDENS